MLLALQVVALLGDGQLKGQVVVLVVVMFQDYSLAKCRNGRRDPGVQSSSVVARQSTENQVVIAPWLFLSLQTKRLKLVSVCSFVFSEKTQKWHQHLI